MRLSLIPRFAEILGLPARPAVQALRCRALTTGKSIGAVRRVRKRSVSLQKPPEASFQGCQEFIGLINVGRADTEEPTAAAAAEQTPGKTVAIAAGASTSTDFPCGRSGTGRLSFRLRKLQRNAKHPALYDSLRLNEKRCRDSAPSPEKLSGTTPFFRCAPGWLRSDPKIFPTNHRDSTLLCPRPHRGDERLRYLQ